MVADATSGAGVVRGTLPASQAPQLAALVDRVSEGAEWLSELKLDGYRTPCLDRPRPRLSRHPECPRLDPANAASRRALRRDRRRIGMRAVAHRFLNDQQQGQVAGVIADIDPSRH
jgi:hypothetical protein